jgi:type II secretory pathway pseudopilin PulG
MRAPAPRLRGHRPGKGDPVNPHTGHRWGKHAFRDSPTRAEEGETLIELLMAIVIIALTVSALLGALVTAITSSAEHRSLSTIDTLLNTFAQSAEYEIQQQPGLFQNCSQSPYRVVGAPTPAIGAAGSSATIFVSGFTPNHGLTVTVGGLAASITKGGATNSSGNQAVTFTVPSVGTGPQTVAVSDGSATTTPTTSFTVASGSPSNGASVSGYSLSITSVTQWDAQSATWVSLSSAACPQSGVQRIIALGVAPDGTSGSINFVVLGKAFTTVLVTSSPANPILGDTVTFTATVIPPTSTTPVPAGMVQWTFSQSPNNPTCAPSTVSAGGGGNKGQATCSVSGASVGTYTLTADYAGTNYGNGSGTGVATVGRATPSVVVSASPSSPLPGSKITFTATVKGPLNGDPTPSGSVQWAFAPSSPGSPTCPSSALNGSGNSSTSACVINSAQLGTYTVTATYSSDGNYTAAASPPLSTGVSKGAPMVTVNPAPANPSPGSTFTFNVTVSGPNGAPTPSGQVTWTIVAPSGPNPTCPNSTLNGTGQGTCTITNALNGVYQATAAYGGDASYNSATGSGSATVSLAPAGSDIQGVPNPTDGVPDNNGQNGQPGDQIVYTYNQLMSAGSILNGWNGTSRNVVVQFTRQNGQSTAEQVCTSQSCNTVVHLGTVSLGDPSGNRYLNGGSTANLNATMSMATVGGKSVVTITLTAFSNNLNSLNPPNTTTALVWTPSASATSTGGTPCSTAPVTESGSPKRNF